MARLNVSPNRMELTALREKLEVAKRGHKLLKDKQDALVQRFISLAEQAQILRREVEVELSKINSSFLLASAMEDQEKLLLNLSFHSSAVHVHVKNEKILNLHTPVFDMHQDDEELSGREKLYPYSFLSTSSDMDVATMKFRGLLPTIIELAQKEKACQILSEEIHHTRRRVNALEFRTIVDIEETIEYVMMQINENERNNISRLMSMEDKK